MKAKRQVSGTLTAKDVDKAIKLYLKGKGFKNCVLQYNIRSETADDDIFAELPAVLALKTVTFVGEEA
jgi:hypothetical protein